jgi:hypothetical protein
MPLLKPAAAYFAVVFGFGCLLCVLRILWLVPYLGDRNAELLETPFMLTVTVFAAKWITGRFEVRNGSSRLAIGFIALGLLLAAELAIGLALRGMSASESLVKRDPFLATTYYGAIALFALMPWMIGRFGPGRSA